MTESYLAMRYTKISVGNLILLLLTLGCASDKEFTTNQTISFKAEDGVTVTADFYPSARKSDPTIVMFHQSASSRGEYQTIAPRLQQRGFNCLAVDLRWGKKDFWNGVENETARAYGSYEVVDNFVDTDAYQYEEVWPRIFDSYLDMTAALKWLKENDFDGDLIVWGSSFSAMLQFKLAREFPEEIEAMVSYSPGEYYEKDTVLLRSWSSEVTQPVFIAAGQDTAEYLMTRPILESLKGVQPEFFQAVKGRHGSSVLLQDEANWPPLISFLQQFKTYKKDDYLDLARQAGFWLQSKKIKKGDDLIWRDVLDDSVVSMSYSNGVSGTVLFYSDLFRNGGSQEHMQEAQSGADYLLKNLPEKSDSLNKVSWAFSPYGNVCGTGYALLEMYNLTGEEAYKTGVQHILGVLDHFSLNQNDTVSWDLGNDVLGGLSGTGLFLLAVAETFEDSLALSLARSAGRTLISRATESGNTLTWKRGQDGNFTLPNFSHGAAGIGYFLARLFERTGDPEFLEAAQKSINYLDSIAYTEDNTYLIPYGFPDPGWSRAFDIGWAHGPAGVARLFYQMYKIDEDQKWLNRMKACFNGIRLSNAMGQLNPMFGTRPFSIDQRFGLTSVASFALDLYSVTKDLEYLNYAQHTIDYIMSKASFKDGLHWPIERFGFMKNRGQVTSFTGYFYGSSGYGALLLKAYNIATNQKHFSRFVDDPFD